MILEPGQVTVLKEVGKIYVNHAAVAPMINVLSDFRFRSSVVKNIYRRSVERSMCVSVEQRVLDQIAPYTSLPGPDGSHFL
jgi:hypothetical protein